MTWRREQNLKERKESQNCKDVGALNQAMISKVKR